MREYINKVWTLMRYGVVRPKIIYVTLKIFVTRNIRELRYLIMLLNYELCGWVWGCCHRQTTYFATYRIAGNSGGLKVWSRAAEKKINIGGFKFGGPVRYRHMYVRAYIQILVDFNLAVVARTTKPLQVEHNILMTCRSWVGRVWAWWQRSCLASVLTVFYMYNVDVRVAPKACALCISV